MNDRIQSFGDTAKGLAQSPLGIIALFIVLVYGCTSLVTVFAGAFTVAERLLLIFFLTIFPVLVLIVFTWLVSKHSDKLYGPSNFQNEDNFIKFQVVALLGAATAKVGNPMAEVDVKRVIDIMKGFSQAKPTHKSIWKQQVLWVDDRPDNNTYERQAFEAMGLRFTLAKSTGEALDKLEHNRYAAIISDMGRCEGSREGYVLLDGLRQKGDSTPLFIYASSKAPEHKQETLDHDGQGCTNDPQELFEMVTRAVIEQLA